MLVIRGNGSPGSCPLKIKCQLHLPNCRNETPAHVPPLRQADQAELYYFLALPLLNE
jgi:hypothetical protein